MEQSWQDQELSTYTPYDLFMKNIVRDFAINIILASAQAIDMNQSFSSQNINVQSELINKVMLKLTNADQLKAMHNAFKESINKCNTLAGAKEGQCLSMHINSNLDTIMDDYTQWNENVQPGIIKAFITKEWLNIQKGIKEIIK